MTSWCRPCTVRSAAHGTKMERTKVASLDYGLVCHLSCRALALLIDPTAGSDLHGIRAIEHPRWEDYTYEYLDPARNRFYWLGDGQTYGEKAKTGDRRGISSLHTPQSAHLLTQLRGTWMTMRSTAHQVRV